MKHCNTNSRPKSTQGLNKLTLQHPKLQWNEHKNPCLCISHLQNLILSTFNAWKLRLLGSPWSFNYSTSHLVHHDLPRGNCIFRLFFYFVFCSTFATNATNLNWPSALLWSCRAFTYKPFSGLIALQYDLHLYSPLHSNMIWRLCPW